MSRKRTINQKIIHNTEEILRTKLVSTDKQPYEILNYTIHDAALNNTAALDSALYINLQATKLFIVTSATKWGWLLGWSEKTFSLVLIS